LPQITSLKIQRNKKRVNLYLDHRFAFGLSLDGLVREGLFVGQKLTDQQVEKLFFSHQLEKLYSKTLNFLSYRPRSEKEIKDYLKKNLSTLPAPARRSFSESGIACQVERKIQSKILKKLKRLKLLNDFDFASWWVNQRLTFRPRGKRLIRAELFQKGISKNIIDKVLSTINNQQSTILAKKVINKKMKFYKKLPELKLRQKLFSHLARRGFDFSLAKDVIDEELEKR